MLMSRAIAFEGERPVFFWHQGYLGTAGCYVTALLFRVFGVSVPLACLVSLAIWASGVGLVTAVAMRLLGARGAVWAGMAAAIASPYANHYLTQPYSSYETAPVLAVLVIAAVQWGERLSTRPLGWRTLAEWAGLGLLLGVGWWTTRLFVPALVTAVVVIALRARWRHVRVQHAAVAAALVLAAATLGDVPELVYRATSAPREAPSFELAPRSQIPTNFVQAARSLPAYLNGDPRARLPEGASFAHEISVGREPVVPPPSAAASAHDALVTAALVAILLAAAYTAVDAWRARDLALLVLCATPFAHFAAIGLSAQTQGGYYEARRYWYAIVLVLPLLLANAVVLGERGGRAARWATRTVAVLLLASATVAQARMLAFPDDLADYRVLARDIAADGERAFWMPTWNAWVVSALSGGRIDGVATHYNRRPQVIQRVAASPRVAVVVPAGESFLPALRVADSLFVPEPGPGRPAGRWQWLPYRNATYSRGRGPGGSP